MPDQNALGSRLKQLRTDVSLPQGTVAKALARVGEFPGDQSGRRKQTLSLSLISSWENGRATPSAEWLSVYAALFATPRSFRGAEPHLVDDLTPEEQARRAELEHELHGLRDQGEQRAPASAGQRPGAGPAGVTTPDEGGALGGSMWHFPDGLDVCIIASKLPGRFVEKIDYADEHHPNYINLLSYADSDALIELFGHIRAENPLSRVTFGTRDQLTVDDLGQHVVLLGGDWNTTAAWYRRRVELPVNFEVDAGDDGEYDGYFVVDTGTASRAFRPTFLGERPESTELEYDIGLFARGPNPNNTDATVTFCQGVFSRGTLGSVRLFTDALVRESNEEQLAELDDDFGVNALEWLVFRVPIADGLTVTPDLRRDYVRLAIGSTPTGIARTKARRRPVSEVTWLEGVDDDEQNTDDAAEESAGPDR